MSSCAWLWIYLGSALVLLELIVPGFVVCFFGLSAATVGLLRFAVGESFTLTWQLAAFSVCSVAYIALFRRCLKRVFVGGRVETRTDFDNESVGRMGRVVEPIAPPLAGRVLIGDAEWAATADVPLAEGANVRVVAQENLTMKVEAI